MKPKFTPGPWKVGKRGRNKDAPNDIDITCQITGKVVMQNSTNLMEAHEQWRNRPADQRFETVTALADAVNSRRLRSRSVDIDVTKIIPEDTGSTVVINSAISPCEPSHWAFGQLATRLSNAAKR